MGINKNTLKKLADLGDKVAKGEVPSEVKEAFADLQKTVDDTKLPFWKALCFKNGKFSKTALFASIGNIVVTTMYVGQSLFAGTVLSVNDVSWVVPSFDAGSAAMILGILNGTYLGNNFAKKGAQE